MRSRTSLGPYATMHHLDESDQGGNMAYHGPRCLSATPLRINTPPGAGERSFIPLPTGPRDPPRPLSRPKTGYSSPRRCDSPKKHRVIQDHQQDDELRVDDYYQQYVQMLMRRAAAGQRSGAYGALPEPGPRHGRAGGQWRHMRRTTECGGSNVMFIDGTVKQEDSLINPPWTWESYNRNPYNPDTRLAYFVAPPVPDPPRPSPVRRYPIQSGRWTPNPGLMTSGWN